MTKQQTKPPAKPPTAKSSTQTAPAVGDLAFDTGTDLADGRPASEFAPHEVIHATDCVLNSQCTLTRECRGRLRQTNAISGKVQIFCPKCGQFAAGTRPLHGITSTSGAKLFDRVAGK